MIFLGPLAEVSIGHGAESDAVVVSLTILLGASLGLGTSVAYWLTFNPTGAYVRWVTRRYRALTAA